MARVQKAKLFSQKEAELLSGLTRSQLRTLEDLDVLVPHRHPSILYSWQQLIFLRIIYLLRTNEWSLQVIERALKNPEVNLEKALEKIEDMVLVYFGSNSLKIEPFIDFCYFSNAGDDLLAQKAKMNMNEGNRSVKRTYINQVEIDVQQVIKDLKESATELQIEDFDLKVG